jgi:hypothetical protein
MGSSTLTLDPYSRYRTDPDFGRFVANEIVSYQNKCTGNKINARLV